jgi:NitT/TauT family transport system substrate-binding protein
MSIARLGCLLLLIHALSSACAHAADRIRIAAQKTGTLAWELGVIKAHGLDKKAGLDLVITELAAPEAGKIALKGGAADVIVTDFLWVARERALGGRLVFAPYGATLGAVMVPATSSRTSLKDLAGAKIGVAGGPIDKSWLMLVALGLGNDIDLRRKATPAYGAPPLLSEKLIQGELDAVLTFWNFSAQLEARGFRRMIEMADVQARLGAKGKVAILGFAFDGQWADRNRGAIDRFLAASQEAKQILAATPAEWTKLAPRIGTTDPAALDLYRRRYAEGVPRRPLDDEIADARALYKVMASIGGKDLVGPALELEPATYWRPARLP